MSQRLSPGWNVDLWLLLAGREATGLTSVSESSKKRFVTVGTKMIRSRCCCWSQECLSAWSLSCSTQVSCSNSQCTLTRVQGSETGGVQLSERHCWPAPQVEIIYQSLGMNFCNSGSSWSLTWVTGACAGAWPIPGPTVTFMAPVAATAGPGGNWVWGRNWPWLAVWPTMFPPPWPAIMPWAWGIRDGDIPICRKKEDDSGGRGKQGGRWGWGGEVKKKMEKKKVRSRNRGH